MRFALAMTWFIACTLPLLVAAQPSTPARASEDRSMRVLILQGIDPWLPAMVMQDQALRRTLLDAMQGHFVDIFTESLDHGRLDVAEFEPMFLELLRQKYARARIDVVVAVGRYGLDFAQKYRDQLWPAVPIVFYAVTPEQLRARTLIPPATGVLAWLDPAPTLALARRLQPDARRLVVVGGVSASDRARSQRIIDAAQAHQAGLPIVVLDHKPVSHMLKDIAALPADSIVIYAGVFVDSAGESYIPSDLARRVSAASSVPVYAIHRSFLGKGIVGGQLNDYAAEGERTGHLVAGILSGAVAPDAPVIEPKISACIVDARQMQRFSLSERRLPEGCTIEFASHSLWLQHRWELLVGLALIVVQGVLIVTLLRQRRRTQVAAAQAQEARVELAHAARLATVGELTAAISHEINQPLGAVQSNADAADMLLESDHPQLERVRQILGDIRAANLRASEVVQRLRALLVKEQHRKEALDLANVVDSVVRLIEGEASRRRVAIECEISTRPLTVVGDPVQLQQVLLNLLMNAMDAMAENGPERRRVRLRVWREDERSARIEVVDLGFGIPPRSFGHLFQSFYTTKKCGMGLGLSITRSIVHAHGGRITAANNAGGGATFTVRLPASARLHAAAPSPLGEPRQVEEA
jgi:signal transduction histidine kinase